MWRLRSSRIVMLSCLDSFFFAGFLPRLPVLDSMLRIISFQLGRTPGNLSVPATNEQVLAPYQKVRRFIGTELQKRRQERQRNQSNRWLRFWDAQRDPSHGVCPICGDYKAINPRGRRFCPTPSCNVPQQFSVPSR